jgi:tetratricopeptide (TPR) repeat protein
MPSIDELLSQAAEALGRGDLARADELCRDALTFDLHHADAWHLRGRVVLAKGNRLLAVEYFSRAILLNGGRADYHRDLAGVFAALGRLAEAEQSCRQALRLGGDAAGDYLALGKLSLAAGRADEAIVAFRRALELEPGLAAAQAGLAATLRDVGRLDEAEAVCREAIESYPGLAAAYYELGRVQMARQDLAGAVGAFQDALRVDPRLGEAEFHLGVCLQLLGYRAEAVECYRRALVIDPRHADAHCNLGSALKDLGQTAEAARAYQRAIECNPQLAAAHFNLGVILQGRGQADAAIHCYEAAIRARPDYAQAWNNLGTLQSARDELDRAAECFARALELKPDSAEALNNLGNVEKTRGRLDKALAGYEGALRAAPGYAQAHHNRGLLLLAQADFAAGWPEYEWRERCPEYRHEFVESPRWQGEPLDGRTLLVHAEQGLGDTLQFVRYLPLLADRGGTVRFQVQPALLPLLRQSGFDRAVELVGRDEPLKPFDVQVPLLSLPAVLGTTLDNIPAADRAYLAADPRLVDDWRERLGPRRGLRVGIAWQGRATYRGDQYRSIPLAQFEPLARDGVELVSLQRGAGEEQLSALAGRFAVRDLGPDFDRAHGAFMDTAAVIENLDLVITSDSAVVHLAGGLGAPVWVALTTVPDWRWFRDRDDSPWYATMRLFRQSERGNWQPVFARIAAALAEFKPRSPR